MNEFLHLSWINHKSALTDTIYDLRQKEIFCDVTIACSGKYFPVHRLILSTYSEYFKEILEMTPCKHPFIIIRDVQVEDLEALLDFIYRGKVEVLGQRVPSLIKAANDLKIKGLSISDKSNSAVCSHIEKGVELQSNDSCTTESILASVKSTYEWKTETDKQSLFTKAQSIEHSLFSTGKEHTRQSLSSREILLNSEILPNNRLSHVGELVSEGILNNREISTFVGDPSSTDESVSKIDPQSCEESRVTLPDKEISTPVEDLQSGDESVSSMDAQLCEEKSEAIINPQSSEDSPAIINPQSSKNSPAIINPQSSEESKYVVESGEKLDKHLCTVKDSGKVHAVLKMKSKSKMKRRRKIFREGVYRNLRKRDVIAVDEKEGNSSGSLVKKRSKSFDFSKELCVRLEECPQAANLSRKLEVNTNEETAPTSDQEREESVETGDCDSELEAAWPQTEEEEEEQLLRALALSKEEAGSEKEIKFDVTMFPHNLNQSVASDSASSQNLESGQPKIRPATDIKVEEEQFLKDSEDYASLKNVDEATSEWHNTRPIKLEPPSSPVFDSINSCEMAGVPYESFKVDCKKEVPVGKSDQSSRLHDEFQNISGFSKPHFHNLGKSKMIVKSPAKMKLFECDNCSYTTKYKCALRNHLMTHSDEKPFKCKYCSYSSRFRGNLSGHMKTHNTEKPFKCKLCPYSAARNNFLINHLKIHTGEKPFKCKHCSYSAAYKVSLRIHLKTHAGEETLDCPFKAECTSDLQSHLRSYHRKVPSFKCKYCSYSNKSKCNLLAHIRIHAEEKSINQEREKPFACKLCPYKASRNNTLVSHLRKKHPAQQNFTDHLQSHAKYKIKEEPLSED